MTFGYCINIFKRILKNTWQPQLYNFVLTGRISPKKYAFPCYFFAFCVVEEVSLVVISDRAILGLIVNYVITML